MRRGKGGGESRGPLGRAMFAYITALQLTSAQTERTSAKLGAACSLCFQVTHDPNTWKIIGASLFNAGHNGSSSDCHPQRTKGAIEAGMPSVCACVVGYFRSKQCCQRQNLVAGIVLRKVRSAVCIPYIYFVRHCHAILSHRQHRQNLTFSPIYIRPMALINPSQHLDPPQSPNLSPPKTASRPAPQADTPA